MTTRRSSPPSAAVSTVLSVWVLLGLLFAPAAAFAQSTKRRNPTSKVYVVDVSGEALIDTGESIEDLGKRSVYTADGTVVETTRPDSEDDRSQHYSTMVYSNGTGAFFDADTRVEVRKFVQEPFTPNRSDVEVEPSISQTQAFVARGTVGLCTSKLVAGSNMNYMTALGSVNIRGRKIVIEAGAEVTKISMLEGDSTVRAGPEDLGGHTLRAGEQALIRRGPPGQPNVIEIGRIPPAEAPKLDEKVAMACVAKKTVYFEVRENRDGVSPAEGGEAVTAFDETTSESAETVRQEIIPVEVVPIPLPKEEVSPSTISASRG